MKKKYSRPPPHFPLKKKGRHFWGVFFGKITQMDVLTKKIKIDQFFSGLFFNSPIEEQNVASKIASNVIFMGLEGKKTKPFLERLTLGTLKKKLKIFTFLGLLKIVLSFKKSKFKLCAPIFRLTILIFLKKYMSKKGIFLSIFLEITKFGQHRVILSTIDACNVLYCYTRQKYYI